MKARRAFLVMLSLFLALISCSRGSQGNGGEIPVPPKGDAVKIGVVVPAQGPLAELALYQAEGLRLAHEMEKGRLGRTVQLVFKELPGSPQGFRTALQGLLAEERVAAVIACASDQDLTAAADILKATQVPLIVTSPVTQDWKRKETTPALRIYPAMEDQAAACARYVADVLKAHRIVLVVDVEDPAIVRLASLFSSWVVKTPTRIVEIAYVKKGEDASATVERLMEKKPDAVYVPFSGKLARSVCEQVRLRDPLKPIVLSNCEPAETFLEGAGKSLEGVRVQSSYMEEAVTSPRGKEFIEYFRKQKGSRVNLGSGAAAGAEAYFLTLDMAARSLSAKPAPTASAAASWKGSLLAITGATPKGSLQRALLFGRITKGFLGTARVQYESSVAVSRSDPVADVRAQ